MLVVRPVSTRPVNVSPIQGISPGSQLSADRALRILTWTDTVDGDGFTKLFESLSESNSKANDLG